MNKVDAVSSDRKKANWGCLSWAVILVIAPIIILMGRFLYEMYFKERLLEASSSPDDQFSIEIVEKGSAFWFGPSEVRIKYKGGHLDQTINNDGSRLSAANVEVKWSEVDTALVTLYGDEQIPDTIEVNFYGKEGKAEVREEDAPGIKASTVQSSKSPNGQYKIEVRELAPLPDEGLGFQNIRVYYGKADGGLEKYEEYTPYESQITSVDEYRVEWFDEKVSIKIMKKNQDFELYIYDTININLTQ